MAKQMLRGSIIAPSLAVVALAPVMQVVESHLFADLDAYADRLDKAAIVDMVEKWKAAG